MQAALPLVTALLLSDCANELAPTSAATVTLQMAPAWPDTLAVAEIATILTDVVGGSGSTFVGVELEWSSSDSSVVRVTRPDTGITPTEAERLSIGRRAVITTHAIGTANITARLNRPGFAPAELRVPVVVEQRRWPALLTVGNQDTVGLGMTDADPAVLGAVTYAWQSSDPSVLQATPAATDASRAQLTARASGTAQVTLTVTGARLGRVEFQQGFSVGSVQIAQQPAWPALLPITETTQLAVTVRDAAGNPAPGVAVRWSSTNLSAFTVDANGVVTALNRGGGEVVASVGSPPFQVAEHRAPLQVVEKWGAVSAGGNHTCGIAASDGTGYCWGSNSDGQLGIGFAGSAIPQASRPRRIATSHKFTELKAGAVAQLRERRLPEPALLGFTATGAAGRRPVRPQWHGLHVFRFDRISRVHRQRRGPGKRAVAPGPSRHGRHLHLHRGRQCQPGEFRQAQSEMLGNERRVRQRDGARAHRRRGSGTDAGQE